MASFLYRMPSGIPGAISRSQAPTNIEPNIILSTNPPTVYGVPVAVDASTGHVRPIGAGDTSALIYGFNVRPFPTQSGNTLGVSTPPTSGETDVLKLGYMTVKSTNGTPSKNGPVYVRVTANGALPNTAVGDVEAAADTPAPIGTPGTNTGNGTIGSLSATAATPAGNWRVVFTGATTFGVFDPSGFERANGTTGTAYTSSDGVSFTITAGATAFAAGDSFTIAVSQNTVKVPGAYFTGAADSNGNAEIAYNIGA
ncbi:MAG: hypothetical protein H5T98_01075 [Syntrophomonadaceae bacterium]|nr:hypothetical protein [Syntrophomonadaceae bacterium]